MNTYKARLKTSTQEIRSPLDMQQTVVLLGKSEVSAVRKTPTNDGFQYTFELKPLLLDLRPSKYDQEEDVSVVDNPIVKEKSPSQSLRHLAFVIAQELGTDDQDLYEQAIEVAREWLLEYKDEEMGYE